MSLATETDSPKRILLILAVFALLLTTATAVRAAAPEAGQAPTAAQIEALLQRALTGTDNRTSLNDRRAYIPAIYHNATVRRFVLRELDGALAPRWRADIELRLEVGDPPSGVIGFQNRRQGIFRLVFERRNTRLELLRFNPVGRVQLLSYGVAETQSRLEI